MQVSHERHVYGKLWRKIRAGAMHFMSANYGGPTCLLRYAQRLGIKRIVCFLEQEAHWLGSVIVPLSTVTVASPWHCSQRN